MSAWGFIWFIKLISNLSSRWIKKDKRMRDTVLSTSRSFSVQWKFKIACFNLINKLTFLYIFVYFDFWRVDPEKYLTDTSRQIFLYNRDEINLLWK